MDIPLYQPRKTDMPIFESFAQLTQEEIRKKIIRMKNKSCELDQIDTSTLRDILVVCLPTITQIVNMSLTKGNSNEDWKTTIVRPLLKNLDWNLYTKTTDLSQTCAFFTTLVEQCML